MPRPRRPGAPEPKRRSRKGCWPCKGRKVKCGEEKPSCLNCRRQNENCDYSIKLNWEGRTRRKSSVGSPSSQSSGHLGQFFSLTLLPSDLVQIDPISSDALLNTSQEQSPENMFWDPPFTGPIASEMSCSIGLHDMHETPPSPPVLGQFFNNSTRTSDRTPVGMRSPTQERDRITSWPDLSTQITEMSRETIPCYSSSLPHSLDGISYPSPADTTSSPRSGAKYGFSPVLAHVSQSVSALDTDTTGPVEDFFAKIMNDTLPSANCTYSTELGSGTPPHVVPTEPNRQVDDHVSVSSSKRNWNAYLANATDNYGLDCGRPDLDLNRNDDHSAIDITYTPDLVNSQWLIHHPPFPVGSQAESTIGNSSDDSEHAYYAFPIPINIPRYLSPLPSSLVETPINLMYFHHFVNHTAKMLVAHNCEDNPFISVLPSMAIDDANILHLMLAYSASHRARYLKHPEPANRIAHWVRSVFPTLRLALEDASENITDNHLATATMLLSLKIISPSTFEVPISWQSHLKLARDLFLARGVQTAYPGNRVGAFLARWIGYIDIMGSLSCRHNGPPLFTYNSIISACSTTGGDDEFSIDCFTGYTPRTGAFLTRLGKLVNQCDNERFNKTGAYAPDWRPSAAIVLEAESLLADMDVLETNVHVTHKHYQDPISVNILSIDRAFRYAGLIHLHRRVLCTPSSSSTVKEALDELFIALEHIGASAEVGALFPLFTAGCETKDFQQRVEIMERLKSLEKTGLKQIQNARTLIQRCWDEDLLWVAVAQGEFLG